MSQYSCLGSLVIDIDMQILIILNQIKKPCTLKIGRTVLSILKIFNALKENLTK